MSQHKQLTPSSYKPRMHDKSSSPNTTDIGTNSEGYRSSSAFGHHRRTAKQDMKLDLTNCKNNKIQAPLVSTFDYSERRFQSQQKPHEHLFKETHIHPPTRNAKIRLNGFKMTRLFEHEISEFPCNAFKYIPSMAPNDCISTRPNSTRINNNINEEVKQSRSTNKGKKTNRQVRIQYNTYEGQIFSEGGYDVIEAIPQESIQYIVDTDNRTRVWRA